jgi:hypothetical protein
MTPRHWDEAPGSQGWAELERKRERREWFSMWASFVVALVVFAILALLGDK